MTAQEAYTDGACERNPGGRGGWGWVVDEYTYGLGGDPSTTNQRMEIRAALEAVSALPDCRLIIWSDSRYVVDCMTKEWWKSWQKNGWKNSKKQPVANQDLRQPLIEAMAHRRVTFNWVKGHSGVQLNEVADRLANSGMLGEAVTTPLDLAKAEEAAKVAKRFVVPAKWTARCKACGDSYTEGTSVTKNEVGWVHAECAP